MASICGQILRISCSNASRRLIVRPLSVSSFRKSAQPIAVPTADGETKQYSENITSIVDKISKLTLVEVADLNELLKKTLKIDDSQLVAHVAPAVAAGGKKDDTEQVAQTQTSFTVKLLKFEDSKKVAVIKAIKALVEGMNLVQAKKFVESAPQVVRADIGKEEAEAIKKQLEEAGGGVEIV